MTKLLENRITWVGHCGPLECSLKWWQIIKRPRLETIQIIRCEGIITAFQVNFQLFIESGQIHLDRIVVFESPSKLFWRDSALVRPLRIGLLRFQRLAIFGGSLTNVCSFTHHQTKWHSAIGKGWNEEVGTFARI